MASIKPKFGIVDKNHMVEVTVPNMNCEAIEPFSYRYNNTDQFGGSGCYKITMPDGDPWIDLQNYNQHGLLASFEWNTKFKKLNVARNILYYNYNEVVLTTTFVTDSKDMPAGVDNNWDYTIMAADLTSTERFRSKLNYANASGTFKLYAEFMTGGAIKYSHWTTISGPDWLLSSLGDNRRRYVVLHLIISPYLINSGNPCAFWYVNGCLIDSFTWNVPFSVSLLELSASVASGGSTSGVTSYYERIKDFGLLPNLIYGNNFGGLVPISIPNELAFASDTDKPVFTNCISHHVNYVCYTPRTFLFPARLKKRTYRCKYPLYIIPPHSTTAEALEFEHIYPNRLHNNVLAHKPPIFMFDKSFQFDLDYKDTGAVFDLTDNESGLVLGKLKNTKTNSLLNNQDQVGSFVPQLSYKFNYNYINTGLGDDNKVNTLGNWMLYPVQKNTNRGSGMKNEYSYNAVVLRYSEMDNNNWPICSNRTLTDPITLYKDADEHNTSMIKLQDCGYRMFRFVEMRNPDDGEHDYVMFTAWRDYYNEPDDGQWNDLQLIYGIIRTNDRVRCDASFIDGYRILTTIDAVQLQDIPALIGTNHSTSCWSQYPDLAIVPVGDPETTTSFRIYYLHSNDLLHNAYEFEIRYFDITDNGANFSGPHSVTFNDYVTHPWSSINKLDSPYQFDVIQPEAGKFIFAVVMGDKTNYQGSGDDNDYALVIFTSEDGISLSMPQIFRTNKLPGNPSTEDFNFCFPSLTWRNIGHNVNEVLLTVSNICSRYFGFSSFKTGVFRLYYTQDNWTNDLGRTWTFLIDCNEFSSEYEFDSEYTNTLCGSAFRDHFGKIHVAVIRMLYNSNDYWGGLYYAVFDPHNRSYEVLASGVGSKDHEFGQYDIVSFARLYQNNKALFAEDVNSYDNMLMIRPKFSPMKNDCYFSVNMQTFDAVETIWFQQGRDPIFRLFQPTDLGELYPPSASWHYAGGVPCRSNTSSTHNVWHRVLSAGTAPSLRYNGLYWTGTERHTTRYYYSQVNQYDMRLPKKSIAVKFRFKYIGNTNDVENIHGGSCMCVNFDNILWGQSDTIGNYYNTSDLLFCFNQDSIQVRDGFFGINYYTASGISNFLIPRDVYIIGTCDVGESKTYWNIYIERSPQYSIDAQERWKPKSWWLVNEQPIETDLNNFFGWTADRIEFGGSAFANPINEWGDDELYVEWFNVYETFYKEPGNAITSAINIGPSSDSIEGEDLCIVGGPTTELAKRQSPFTDEQKLLCPAGFQIGESDDRQYKNIDVKSFVGNNTELITPNFVATGMIDIKNDVFEGENRFEHPVIRLFDHQKGFPWLSHTISANARISFDVQKFKLPMNGFMADSIWLLNCNLINVRLMADPLANWAAPAFSEDIDFIIDSGIAWNVGGVAGDTYYYIEDPTKDWIPNEFVDSFSPFFIIKNDTSATYYGGKIVKNTKTRIYYTLSTQLDGTDYSSIALNDEYAVIAPNKYHEFEMQTYRYWAIDIKPSTGFTYYCEKVAKVGCLGIGRKMEIGEYPEVGMVEGIKGVNKVIKNDDGNLGISIGDNIGKRSFQMLYKNVDTDTKNKIVDMFLSSKRDNTPVWFLPTIANSHDLMLCRFEGSSLDVTAVIEDYNDNSGVYNVTIKLREI